MKTDTQTKNETTNLKVGDEVCRFRRQRHGKDTYYTFGKVARTTNTLAILEDGTRLKNEFLLDTSYGSVKQYYFLEVKDFYTQWLRSTPELKQEAEKEAKRQKMNNWFNHKASTREFTDQEIEIIYEKFKELNLIKEE